MKAKRFLSVLMAVMLMVSCFAIGASADSVSAIKPDGPYTLEVYLKTTDEDSKIATDATVTGKETSAAGKAVGGYTFDVYSVGYGVAEVPNSVDGLTKVESIKTDATGQATFTTATANRYLVVPATDVNQPAIIDKAPVSFLVDLPMTDPENLNSWLTTVKVYPKTTTKVDEPTITKSVADEDGNTAGNGGSVGLSKDEEATWTIVAKLPDTISNYTKYEIVDVLDSRLTYVDGSLKVTFKDSTGAALDDDSEAQAAISKKEYDSNTHKITVACDSDKMSNLPAGGTMVVEFKTTINLNANNAIGKVIANHVDLTYANTYLNDGADKTVDNHDDDTSSDGDTGSDGKTDPEDPDNKYPGDSRYDPGVWTGSVEALKVDGNKKALAGAEFTLYQEDSNGTITINSKTVSQVGTTTSDSSGMVYFKGLDEGTYYLVETKAPSGYELDGSVKTITISASADNRVWTFTGDNAFVNILKNDLPLTGGMGTTMFAILGIAFVAVGGTFLFKSKKAKNVA